jgi:hypothetical protein
MEIVDFHGGDDYFEGCFAGGADGGTWLYNAEFELTELNS